MSEDPGAPSVSVALCTYNGERFLPEQLRSIAEQTVLPNEVVACDDGSSDRTIELLERFASEVPFPVRIVRNPQTLRPAQNFAQAIALCSGDLVILTDQDDVWFADRVEKTREVFAANDDLTFAFSECPLIDGDGAELGRSIYSSVPISPGDRSRLAEGSSLLPLLLRYGVIYGTTMALRGNLKEIFLPLPPGWSHDEWIALTLSAVGPSACLPTPVTRYRQHALQQVGTGDWTLNTHLGLARDHGHGFYEGELDRYREAIRCAERQPILRHALLHALREKLAFLQDRRAVQTQGLRRLPLFMRLLLHGKYARFASSLRSPVKDFLMLCGKFPRKSASDATI